MKYLVQSISKLLTKKNDPYIKLQLAEVGGKSWTAVMWENMDLPVGSVIDALTEAKEYKGEQQLTVKQVRILPDVAAEEFLPRTTKDVEEMLSDLEGFVGAVKNNDIKLLLSSAITDPRWKRAPAAKGMHHAFLGGLLEHVLGLCRLSHAVSLLYPGVDCDLLVAASILHDIGKFEEYKLVTSIEYTDVGNLVGHIVLGSMLVDKWMESFPYDLRIKILHIIASHHEKMEFGAAKRPQTLEAWVFCQLDDFDARMNALTTAIAKTPAGNTWTEKVPYIQGDRLYLGQPEGK